MKSNSTICFISCVNDETLYQTCRDYLSLLKIPDGFEVEYLPVHNAPSIFAGYNQAMLSSPARYKVYLHQDLFILNPFFIQDILDVFKQPDIGLIGLIGSRDCPLSGRWWDSKYLYGRMADTTNDAAAFGDHQRGLKPRSLKKCGDVSLVDGTLMATQYDLQWREDVFQKWHFYDVSQCLEFIRAGYRVFIPPNQSWPWSFHDTNGPVSWEGYEGARQVFLREYEQVIKQQNEMFGRRLQRARIKYALKILSRALPKPIRRKYGL